MIIFSIAGKICLFCLYSRSEVFNISAAKRIFFLFQISFRRANYWLIEQIMSTDKSSIKNSKRNANPFYSGGKRKRKPKSKRKLTFSEEKKKIQLWNSISNDLHKLNLKEFILAIRNLNFSSYCCSFCNT